LNKLDNLLKVLNDSEVVKRYKVLEKLINQDENLSENYKLLLELQKVMVQEKTLNTSKYAEAKEKYEQQREIIYKNFIIEEYLDVLEEINNDIQLIQEMINNDIQIDFE